MKTNHIYEITLWKYLQKLFKSKGDSLLLISTIVLTVIIVAVNAGSLSAQSKDKKGTVKIQDLPEIKQYEYLPDAVQDMPLELQYFNGKPTVRTSFRDLSENFVQLFFWDTSYPGHYTDLKKIFEYKEEMGNMSTFILVISKKDKATLNNVKTTLDRFNKEFQIDTDIACVIGNTNLDQIFKVNAFPKYVQINKDAVFVSEKAAEELFKVRDRRKNMSDGK